MDTVLTPPTPQTLAKQFKEVRDLSLEICEPLQPEDFVVQPVVDVSPPKWHLAHTTWFFEVFLLNKFLPGYKLFNKDYPFLFNSYYENEGERWIRSERGALSRPAVNEIKAYRAYVDEHMEKLLQEPLTPEQTHIFEIGLNHEQQHQELLVYDIKHILGINPLFPVYKEKVKPRYQPNLSSKWLTVEEGVYKMGYAGQQFHFDNEEGEHQVFLHAYEIQDRLITNGEFMEFINAGAYQDFNLWLMEGHEWVKKENIRAPFYWMKEGKEWYHFTLSGKERVNPEEPVTHISFYEADAFAKWKGMRLPTEQEWEVACRMYSPQIPEEANLMDCRNFRTMPRKGNNPQFYGDVWEWTNSSYLPYPYYKKVEGALGEYNGKFMVNQMVLRGGSFATMKNHIRPSYRNFFHPNLRWHFTGFRLAQHI
ncbi:ergothioneine biosynthesis protein EgtB [Roseivirga thermotolerans]|uniref:Ergothioneine biosynthesis protein EgtB n=1 Tax=Roseivirga thermotolerans TaxID=1758176 RepID=A0ABQ3I5G5_9BACT|nr:ergothioneine biosynthesis protein EgtB [Roseivirga thermotolerans]GHE64738.1 ergothioneine biosynthesis protein EgtB [Roseivirga thermotolerans]